MERVIGKQYRSYWMGISMSFIILFHLVYQRGTSDAFFRFLKMLFLQGEMGVNIFFFLSAYGLCHSFRTNSIGKFYWKRVKRLYPMYLLFLIGILLFRIEYRSAYFEWSFFLNRIFGLTVFGTPNELTGDAWYMSACIILYAIFPLLYKGIDKLASKGWQWVFLLIMVLTLVYYIPGTHLLVMGMFHARFQVIALGIATYFYLNSKAPNSLLKLYACTASLSLLTYNDCSFYFFIPLILWAFDKATIRFPLFNTMSFIGQHSLEIYLAQVFGLQVLFDNGEGNYYLDAFMGLMVTACLSVVLYYFQEYFLKVFPIVKR